MSESIEEQMLEAMELFHYSYKFRNSVFVLVVKQARYLSELASDLRVLHSSHIRLLLCCNADAGLEDTLNSWKQRGYRYEAVSCKAPSAFDNSQQSQIQEIFAKEGIPVLLLSGYECSDFPPSEFDRVAFSIAHRLGSRKLFFISEFKGLTVDGVFQSHPSQLELDGFISGNAKINIGMDSLKYLTSCQRELGTDIVILEGRSGSLYQEIFTHRGVGTLLTEHFQSECRTGQAEDIRDIALLLKPYILSGTILPISEDEIASTIQDFMVYTVNDEIVATAKMVEYEDAYELAKFATLPRYQRKGRARALALELIERARTQRKQYVFAASIEPQMQEFFQGLGFQEVSKQDLPQKWRFKYDPKRPSKVFRLNL